MDPPLPLLSPSKGKVFKPSFREMKYGPCPLLCEEWGVSNPPCCKKAAIDASRVDQQGSDRGWTRKMCGEVLCAVFRQGFFLFPQESVSLFGPSSAARFFFLMEKRKESKERHAIDGQVGQRGKTPNNSTREEKGSIALRKVSSVGRLRLRESWGLFSA